MLPRSIDSKHLIRKLHWLGKPVLCVDSDLCQNKMEIKSVTDNDDNKASLSSNQESNLSPLRASGWVGVVVAAPFFLWVPLGFTGLIPSMIDVFGIVGLRIPAAVTIAGLLIAAVGFHRI